MSYRCFLHGTEGFCGQCFDEALSQQAKTMIDKTDYKPSAHIIVGPNGMCLCGAYNGRAVTCSEILTRISESELSTWKTRAEKAEDELALLKPFKTVCDQHENENICVGVQRIVTERDTLKARCEKLEEDRAKIIENLRRESRLACDLRTSQDQIIERCAQSIAEKWPEAGELNRERDKYKARFDWMEKWLLTINDSLKDGSRAKMQLHDLLKIERGLDELRKQGEEK